MSGDDIKSGVALWNPDDPWMRFSRAMDAPQVWQWYTIIQQFGIDGSIAMFEEAAQTLGVELPSRDRMRGFMQSIHQYGQVAGDKEQSALRVSYQMLHEREWTRAQAAKFASWMLGKEIEVDTWRKRLDKYIRDEKLAPIKLPHGRPSRENRKLE